jgi:maleylpyruvate isomerase
MGEAEWAFESRGAAGSFSVWQLLVSRWQEVEVHHVDLDLAYGPEDWPAVFVDRELNAVIPHLAERLPPDTALRLVVPDDPREWQVGPAQSVPTVVTAPAAQLLAWAFGRPSSVRDVPEIGSWH